MSETVKAVGTVVFCCVVALLPGCTKTPLAEVKLPPALEALQTELDKAIKQIDVTVAALDAVVTNAASAQPHFEKYVKEVEALEAQAAASRTRADAMRSQGKAYFEAWEKQLAAMSSPDILERAKERQADLAKEYQTVTDLAQKAREAYGPFMSDLQDIKKVLQNELTEGGIKVLAPIVKKTKDDAGAVKERVAAVASELKNIVAIYSPGTE